MYKGLWIWVQKHTKKEIAVSAYLVINILCWTAATIILGIAGTPLLQKTLPDTLTTITCAGAYAGIIFGLLGGILYLQIKKY